MLEGVFGLLVFVGTALGWVVGFILAGLALVTRRFRRAGQIGGVLLAWLSVYAAALLAFSLTSQPHYLQPGEERCFDEMCYSIQAVFRTHSLGLAPQELSAQGEFTILTVQLRSAAKGRAQRPSEPGLFILDADGRRYSRFVNAGSELNLPIGQALTPGQLWDQPVQPGETVRRTLAFDLPAGIRQPGLVISEGMGAISAVIIGDEGSLFHAQTEFLLPQ